ncbi:MAG: hypothetical protein WAK57_10345 [Desulfobacterales bacterium]
MTIALLKHEAELYHTQGLHREAISVYEKILETGSALDSEVRQAAQCRVAVLAQELAALESGPEDAFLPAEVDLIRGRVDELAGHGKWRLALAARWGRLCGALVSENGACRGFFHRLRFLLAALAHRIRAKGYPAARS